MGRLTARSPAAWGDCLDMGGSRALARKGLIWMRSNGDSVAILDDGDLIALAFLVPLDGGETELALSIRPRARARMRELVRFAHLTLSRLADTGAVIICHVMPGNRSGERMARLVGFGPDDGTRWKWSGNHDAIRAGSIRRGKQGGEGGSGAQPRPSEGRQ